MDEVCLKWWGVRGPVRPEEQLDRICVFISGGKSRMMGPMSDA
jgi:hypothetical protein